MQLQTTTNRGYRFQSGKCTVTLKFSKGEAAPTVEEALVKIAARRIL